MKEKLSILYPAGVTAQGYHTMSDTSWHDLGMDLICEAMTRQPKERLILKSVMTRLSTNPVVSKFRGDVFEDIMKNQNLKLEILDILQQVDSLRDKMSTNHNINDADGIWTLMRRMKEVQEYILCIEKLDQCLESADVSSEGLLNLKSYVKQVQSDCAFAELKKDIHALLSKTQKIKSITLGCNLSDYYDVKSVGIVSVNDKPFNKAGLLTNFSKKFVKGDQIQSGNEWNHNYTYEQIPENKKHTVDSANKGFQTLAFTANPLMGLSMGLAGIQENTREVNLVEYLNDVVNKLMASSVKSLKETMAKYATLNIEDITGLIPEFQYYVLWANYIDELMKEGYSFAKATLMESTNGDCRMQAKQIYNLKLASYSKTQSSEIVGNDLDFSNIHTLYLLTGANRGGKTTITQAVGQCFVLAQGGIYIPGAGFDFVPVDDIFTHFPADEDKTMDFGRLGEECQRFKELYKEATTDSLLLLNESFSTTSFEEGYFIACDAVRAILKKGCRTIYNTHMHKLARDVKELNAGQGICKAASLIVKSEEGKRSYKVEVAPASGLSLADDIARKYGVTYEQLVGE